MKFSHMSKFWVTDFGWPDVSFGVHICTKGRVDVHFLKWMFSFGKVPVYQDAKDKRFAAANSFHDQKVRNAVRAGTPDYDERRPRK